MKKREQVTDLQTETERWRERKRRKSETKYCMNAPELDSFFSAMRVDRTISKTKPCYFCIIEYDISLLKFSSGDEWKVCLWSIYNVVQYVLSQ